jgi:hypothetical protein
MDIVNVFTVHGTAKPRTLERTETAVERAPDIANDGPIRQLENGFSNT